MRPRTRVVVVLIVLAALVVAGCRDDRNGLATTAPNDAARGRTPAHDRSATTARFSDEEFPDVDIVTDLVNYMTALTDDGARHINRLVPDRVPSHLPVVPRNP